MAKTNKRTIMKGHSIARSIGNRRGVNPFAVGMAVAKRAAAKGHKDQMKVSCWLVGHKWCIHDVSGSMYYLSGTYCLRCGEEQAGGRYHSGRNWFTLWGKDPYPAKVFDKGKVIGRMPFGSGES